MFGKKYTLPTPLATPLSVGYKSYVCVCVAASICSSSEPIPERMLFENRSSELLEDMKRQSLARVPSVGDHLRASIDVLREVRPTSFILC